MVKDFFRGFGYTIGKILAFIFIAFLIMFLMSNIDSDDIKKIPFKQLIMKTLFVESHALDKNAVFYYGVGTNQAGRYLTLNDQQATQGVAINHTSGSFPNGLAVFITNSTFTQGAKYVLNANYTIRTYYRYALPNNWLSVGTWSNPNDTVGTSTVIINTQNSCGMNCYESNVTFSGEWTQPWNTSAIIAFSQFDASNEVTYFKLNTFTTTKVADNSDVVNSVNQNTNLVINNINENTENIVNAQNDTTEAIEDMQNTILDDTHQSPQWFFDDMEDLMISDTPITDLITLPGVLFAKFKTGISGQCSTISLGTWLDHPISIPCINLERYLGSNLVNIIDILMSGFMIFHIIELLIYDFNNFISLNDIFYEVFTPNQSKKRG